MIIETFLATMVSPINHDKEHFGALGDELDNESKIMLIVYGIWIIFWIITIVSAVKLAKKYKSSASCKNTGTGLILSVLSWPFYWIFYWSGAIG